MSGKNLRKKIFTAVMTAALAVVSALAPLQGAAAAEESGAITVHFAPGTTFTVYKVADYAETGEFTLTDAFKGAQVENLEKIEKEMEKIADCVDCGVCMTKCPYGLETPRLLRENLEDYRRILSGEIKPEGAYKK